MIQTTSHTPDLGRMIIFPAELMQHQITILILVTHILMSLPVINTPTYRGILFDTQTPSPNHVVNTSDSRPQMILFHMIQLHFNIVLCYTHRLDHTAQQLNLLVCVPLIPFQPSPISLHQYKLTTSHLLLPFLLRDGKSKRVTSTTPNRTQHSSCPRPAK